MTQFEIRHGDSLFHLREMADNSVDAIITDPPYGLGKEPDALAMLAGWLEEGHHDVKGRGFMGKDWDAFVPQPALWREALRVLKPGGHLLAFGGSRTYDLVTLGLRIAGFELRDTIMWIYGSGFPKSHNLDGAHKGWGTALKPAHEPIVVARKPLIGTVAANVLAHGTGALNIDGCRTPTTENLNGGAYSAERKPSNSEWVAHGGTIHSSTGKDFVQPDGRWPANLVHDGSEEVVAAFPNAPGQLADASSSSSRKTQNVYGAMNRGNGREGEPSKDSKNACAVGFNMKPGARRQDAGSAARFFYCAKASKADRNEGCENLSTACGLKVDPTSAMAGDGRGDGQMQNNHPTVKPTELMRWLVRLVTPPGGLVLDPFAGSGSTGKAAILEGFRFIGIDLEERYVEIARARCEDAVKKADTSAEGAGARQLDLLAPET